MDVLLTFIFLIIVAIASYNRDNKPPANREPLFKIQDKNVRRGISGESDIVNRFKYDIPVHLIFRNAYVKTKNGLTEIDVILLHKTGIYVIESKNYKGLITGNVNYKFWKHRFYNSKAYEFYNPVWQNKTHVNAIRHELNLKKSDLKSYVVFGSESTLGNIYGETDTKILHIDSIRPEVLKDMKSRPIIFNDKQMVDIQEWLEHSANVSYATKMQHIESVKNKKLYN